MTKPKTAGEMLTDLHGQQPPLDYTVMKVTLTVAVETYLCDEQSNLRESAAIETVLERLAGDHDEIIVLGSKFEPVTMTAVRR